MPERVTERVQYPDYSKAVTFDVIRGTVSEESNLVVGRAICARMADGREVALVAADDETLDLAFRLIKGVLPDMDRVQDVVLVERGRVTEADDGS